MTDCCVQDDVQDDEQCDEPSAPHSLREGFSTGACATALCVANWQRLTTGVADSTDVALLFPDGKIRTLAVRFQDNTTCTLTKDGGDDPDCTHGAAIYGRLCPCPLSEARPEDYCLAVGNATVVLRGVEGIGLCTRPGLDCEQGKWAINSVPRAMIAANLARAGMCSGSYLAELGIEQGATLAKNTLNPQLGIVGGLSVLGTTGLVRPFSHDAYIQTVRLCVNSNALLGGTSMVFCTGGRTKAGAERTLPDLPATAFVCIGDFIAESLRAACTFGMKDIVVACMVGKLCKYASGFDNTHAHKVRQDRNLLQQEVLRLLPDDKDVQDALADSVSVREALLFVPQEHRPAVLRSLADKALTHFVGHMTQLNSAEALPTVRLLLFAFDGTLVLDVQA
ncbi:MAG: cobalt-precorrin-5B (C(1))-methyltransferase CbiD [Bilophila sp.]